MEHYEFTNDGIYVPSTNGVWERAMVNDPNAQPDLNNNSQKYIKAGMPLAGKSNFLTSKQPVTLQPTNDASQVQGILLHTHNITNGETSASVMTAGNIDLSQMDSTVAALYTDSFIKQLKQSLPRITVTRNSTAY